MKKYRIFVFFSFCLSIPAFSQKVDSINIGDFQNEKDVKLQKDTNGKTYYWDKNLNTKVYIDPDGDRIIEIDEVKLVAKPIFNNQLDRNYYSFLNKKLFRVYPLFLKALDNYNTLEEELQTVPENQRRSFARKRQNELGEQYEAQLRDLTTSEGQIFAKLMNRATGKNVYTLIKELRGGWTAFWWNVKGNLASIELKKDYNPYLNREDEFIESLLLSNWAYGYLKPYKGYKDFVVKKSRD